MISVEIGDPIQLNNNVLVKQSAFISFEYNSDIVKFLQDMSIRAYDPKTRSWEIPVNSLPKFCNTFDDYTIKIYGTYKTISSNSEYEIPEEYQFKTVPFSHQKDAIRFGLNLDRFILADEQGLGKSKEIIDLACCNKNINKVLIICGVNGLKWNWEKEIETHSNEKSIILGNRIKKNGTYRTGSAKEKLEDLENIPEDVKFIITNIESLRIGVEKEKKGNKTIYHFPIVDKIVELCDNNVINMIAFDEAHKARNTSTLQGQAMLKLHAKYMVAATGTPIMNNPLDSYFPLYWLGYETHSLFMFKQHYCILGGMHNSEILGYKNLPQLRDTLSQVMLRRTKDEVLDLPEKIHTVEYVEMSTKQTKIYEEVRNNIREHINKIRFSNNPMAELIRLRQATGYTGILSDEVQESAKLDRMEELVEELTENNRKCIVYSNWSEITKIARERLAKYNPAYITGETKDADRILEVERFQKDDDCKVIIGTIGAMGTGLTLTEAQTVIFLDSPWNRALKDQAEDRAHRIGTKGTVNIITIVCKNTIDERIEDIVYRKGLISDMLIDNKGNKLSMNLIEQLLN